MPWLFSCLGEYLNNLLAVWLQNILWTEKKTDCKKELVVLGFFFFFLKRARKEGLGNYKVTSS